MPCPVCRGPDRTDAEHAILGVLRDLQVRHAGSTYRKQELRFRFDQAAEPDRDRRCRDLPEHPRGGGGPVTREHDDGGSQLKTPLP